MDYQGYYTQEQVLDLVEKAFPYVERPNNKKLFLFSEDDVMTRILEPKLSKYQGRKLDSAGVLILYDEFSSITKQAVRWLFPSLLRVLVSERDPSGNLYWSFPSYFENIKAEDALSAYNLSWLSNDQIHCLCIVLEHLSERYDDIDGIAAAQEQLTKLIN